MNAQASHANARAAPHRLRGYQLDAIAAIHEQLRLHQSTLAVMATGTGKSVVAGKVIADRLRLGRALFLAHREELIDQAAGHIARETGAEVDIEMAERWAGDGMLHGGAPIVVASVQSLCSGDRIKRFDPAGFATVVIDEAHHAVADTYRRVVEWFVPSPSIEDIQGSNSRYPIGISNRDTIPTWKSRLLGITATPDRKDEEALGKVFQSVAFDYEIVDAVQDGWLVRPVCRTVKLHGLDLSGVRTTAGEFNGRDLAAELGANHNLEAIAAATVEHSKDRRTLVFADSVTESYIDQETERRIVQEGNAPKLTVMLNGHKPGSARLIHGGTEREERKGIVADYRAGRFQYLVNVGVATEGFDVPDIACVVLARPTKSRALCSQMVGRGTRPASNLATLLGELPTDVARREAIARSDKSDLLIVDFVDNTNRHDLIHPANILGGRMSQRAMEIVAGECEGMPVDVIAELERVEGEIRHNDELAAAARSRKGVRAVSSSKDKDPFAIYGLQRRERRGWEPQAPLDDHQREKLEKWGVKGIDKLDFSGAAQLIEEYQRRARNGLCTIKQAALLRKNGKPDDVTFEKAREMIDEIAKRWR